MSYEIGDLVNWIEEYADGDIIKDTGVGILLGITDYTYNDLSYKTYSVYRSKYEDVLSISGRNISKLITKRKTKK